MFKEDFNYIFNLFLVQLIFNNILIFNIIKNIILYKFKNLFSMFLEYLFNIINIGYNKYRFDKLENDNCQFKENFIEINNKIDKLENDNCQFKENFIEINNRFDKLENDNCQFKKNFIEINNRFDKLENLLLKILEK